MKKKKPTQNPFWALFFFFSDLKKGQTKQLFFFFHVKLLGVILEIWHVQLFYLFAYIGICNYTNECFSYDLTSYVLLPWKSGIL